MSYPLSRNLFGQLSSQNARLLRSSCSYSTHNKFNFTDFEHEEVFGGSQIAESAKSFCRHTPPSHATLQLHMCVFSVVFQSVYTVKMSILSIMSRILLHLISFFLPLFLNVIPRSICTLVYHGTSL